MQFECPHWTSRDSDFIPPRRRRDIIENELDGEATLFDPHNGNTYQLNQTSYVIWRQCDGRTTMREIAKCVTASFKVDVDTASDHVEQLVARLAESRLLELSEYYPLVHS
ncbi:MAG: HPr-rel-A system PqqD family peptide chaperone [Phycisphaerales bacterium]|nr:HPr-rel-A system PqqD family peptide chaperone [Phycisphaerales bacterium]